MSCPYLKANESFLAEIVYLLHKITPVCLMLSQELSNQFSHGLSQSTVIK
jgi:hypothetical protein